MDKEQKTEEMTELTENAMGSLDVARCSLWSPAT